LPEVFKSSRAHGVRAARAARRGAAQGRARPAQPAAGVGTPRSRRPKLRASSPRAPQQRASPPRRLPLGNLSVLRCAPVRSEICLRCGRCGVPAALLRVPPLRVFRRPAPRARP